MRCARSSLERPSRSSHAQPGRAARARAGTGRWLQAVDGAPEVGPTPRHVSGGMCSYSPACLRGHLPLSEEGPALQAATPASPGAYRGHLPLTEEGLALQSSYTGASSPRPRPVVRRARAPAVARRAAIAAGRARPAPALGAGGGGRGERARACGARFEAVPVCLPRRRRALSGSEGVPHASTVIRCAM